MMSNWFCWYCCQRTRTLTATELLVAASYNTAVRRISRVNSDDSLDNVSLKYNTFTVPTSRCPSPTRSLSSFKDNSGKNRDDEMVQLVKPLKRHQEQLKITARFDEGDTLRMAGPGTPRLNRRSSFDSESRSSMMGNSSDDNSVIMTENVISAQDADDLDFEDENRGPEGKTADYPLDECFGSVIVSARKISPKLVAVLLVQLRGVPWVGSNEGLTVEVKAVGSSKSEWVFLPNASGPEVNVQREVTVKLHRQSLKATDISSHISPYPTSVDNPDEDSIQIAVWSGCSNQPRYTAIGYAIIPIRNNDVHINPAPRIMGLYGHTKIHSELGSLEISLSSSSISSSNTTRTRGVLVKILKAQGLQKPNFHWIAKKAKKALSDKDRLDVWCSVTLWISGDKVKKVVTPKVVMPVTSDPEFKSSCTFFVPKREQHKACIVIKIHCGRSIHEVTIGRLVLGPLLYLGTYRHPPLLPLDTSTPRPVTLSYWGQSLNCPYPITAWHRLKL